ncbi:hypothetical protein UH38_22055 [Aliterella atlantica CENA595]|uniref:Uncharacterized protein n=1 Tax=Aliterella atlantica CENA595 TaxID=1618023 RepID=A0A0D8ZRH7_9CYAN|nr:hypothetical protein UH38_22055 [Aliterella atlantica CENA595]
MEMPEILKQALEWGKAQHPDASQFRHAALANSVSYLVTGFSGGYGGPSIREHCVSYALVGDGYNIPTQTNLGLMTMSFPEGRLPQAGNWEFGRACEFAAPICYGQLPAIAGQIAASEYCFDDDPNDLLELQASL